jgi:hypothetical protein
MAKGKDRTGSGQKGVLDGCTVSGFCVLITLLGMADMLYCLDTYVRTTIVQIVRNR